MADRKYGNLLSHRTEYNAYYTDMKGVDLSGDGSGIAKDRFAYLENLWRDYDGDGAGLVESFPGFRKILSLGDRINGIHALHDPDGTYLFIHAGTKLYRLALADRDAPGTLSPIAALADEKSRSFAFGEFLYLLDGSDLFRAGKSGNAVAVARGVLDPYVPTTYKNGLLYEQRNLLTADFSEEYDLTNAELYSYGSEGLLYRVTDTAAYECAVVGYTASLANHVYVPSRVKIGEHFFTVSEIAEGAFSGKTGMLTLRVANGVRRIGALAFANLQSLYLVHLPDSLTEIGNGAFSGCFALSDFHVGRGLLSIGSSAFSLCSALTEVSYAGTAEEYAQIEGTSAFGGATVTKNDPLTEISVELPIGSPAASLSGVTVNGTAKVFTAHNAGGYPVGVILHFTDRAEIDGATVRIAGLLRPGAATGGGFLSDHPEYLSAPADLIRKCRIAEAFDGRIFLSGNPAFPNVVFYTARTAAGVADPLYFGEFNYFSDGVGNYGVSALLSAGDSLAVFKSGDDGTGSIFYHTPKETGEDLVPKVYPVSYTHSGTPAVGEVLSFFDDPVFLSERGVSALDKPDISRERSVAVRSHNVNPKLLSEDLSRASLASWCGYLVVGAGERLYLADSRATFRHPTGSVEYEWYLLTGIGSYTDDHAVYRYAATAPEGYEVGEPEARAKATVYSEVLPGGVTVYYTNENGKRYALRKTEEYEGGDFHPERVLFSSDGLLFFGTENGDVCLVNTDKRGVPPAALSEDDGFSPAQYAATLGRRIHPSHYSYDRHAMRCALKTKFDDCGIPHLTKNTVRRSLVIKCRAHEAGQIAVEVATDCSGYREVTRFPMTSLSFADLDFSMLSLVDGEYYSLAIGERERDWVEKQITVYTDEPFSPIGLSHISYRYTVKGRIRAGR